MFVYFFCLILVCWECWVVVCGVEEFGCIVGVLFYFVC